MPTNATTILQYYSDQYEQKYGVAPNINAWHVKLAQGIAPFYTAGRIKKIVAFYFQVFSKHDIVFFLNNIDAVIEESQLTEESNKRVEALIKDTKRRMKSVYNEH